MPHTVKYFCRSLFRLSLVLSMHSSLIFTEFWYVCGDVAGRTYSNHSPFCRLADVTCPGRACETSQLQTEEARVKHLQVPSWGSAGSGAGFLPPTHTDSGWGHRGPSCRRDLRMQPQVAWVSHWQFQNLASCVKGGR